MRSVVGKRSKGVVGGEAEVGKERGPVRVLLARVMWFEMVRIVLSPYMFKMQLSVSEF